MPDQNQLERREEWFRFLKDNNFDFRQLKEIDLTEDIAVLIDPNGNRFSIDFISDRRNYHKKKSSIKKELIARALGSGRLGLRILDLSAGLGIDAVFLSQLGFQVTALERNPLIYRALRQASDRAPELKLKIIFASAVSFLQNNEEDFDVIYYDPMFPEKVKSALPRQEMVFFRHLVGDDSDATQVLETALQKSGVKRVVVKRPIKAPFLQQKKPESQIEGKLVRFDIYGVRR